MNFSVELINKTKEVWYNSAFFTAILSAILPILLTIYMQAKQERRNEASQEEMNNNNEKFQEKLNEINNQFQNDLSERNNEMQDKLLQKEIDANIISQSIVKWLSQSRTFSTEFIAASINCLKNYNMASSLCNSGAEEMYLKNNQSLAQLRAEETNKYKEKANINREDAVKYLAQFELQFGIDDENQQLVNQAHQVLDLINEIVDVFHYYTSRIQEYREAQVSFPEKIQTIAEYADYYISEIFVYNCRLYYKREWDKAKGVESGKGYLNYVEVDNNNLTAKAYREIKDEIDSILDSAK